MARKREALQQRLDHAFARLHAQRPQARLARARERARALEQQLRSIGVRAIAMRSLGVARLRARLSAQDPQVRLARQDDRARALGARLRAAIVRTAERRALRLAELARTLNAVSPLATLDRGYAILLDRSSGHVVRSVSGVSADSKLRARLHDGEIDLRVDPE
jgi:exodeoxyribonuclease VII large subunit